MPQMEAWKSEWLINGFDNGTFIACHLNTLVILQDVARMTGTLEAARQGNAVSMGTAGVRVAVVDLNAGP